MKDEVLARVNASSHIPIARVNAPSHIPIARVNASPRSIPVSVLSKMYGNVCCYFIYRKELQGIEWQFHF